MIAHRCRRAFAPTGRRFAHSLLGLAPIAGVCALLAGCSGASAPIAGAHPADPNAPTRPAAYRGVIGPYVSQRPGEPSEWRRSNERVAPQEKP
jgi:hypothetical protein